MDPSPDNDPVRVDGPVAVRSLAWSRGPGEAFCTVIAKATFTLAQGQCSMAPIPDPILEHDVFWFDDPRRSVRAPSDWAPLKTAAEVTLSGSAYTESKRDETRVHARLVVGSVDKTVEAWAPRKFSSAGEVGVRAKQAIFPLAWEFAAGAGDTDNPVGVECNHDGSIPSLQPAGFAYRHPSDYVPPSSFAPVAPSWPARRRLLRPEHAAWVQRGFDGPIPAGFEIGWFQAAPVDQRLDAPISADARILLEALHPDHPRLVTNLPGFEPRLWVWSPLERAVRMVADALHIDTDQQRVTLTWRASFPLHRGVLATVSLRRMGEVVPPDQVKHLRGLHQYQTSARRQADPMERTAADAGPSQGAILPFPAGHALGVGATPPGAGLPFGGAEAPRDERAQLSRAVLDPHDQTPLHPMEVSRLQGLPSAPPPPPAFAPPVQPALAPPPLPAFAPSVQPALAPPPSAFARAQQPAPAAPPPIMFLPASDARPPPIFRDPLPAAPSPEAPKPPAGTPPKTADAAFASAFGASPRTRPAKDPKDGMSLREASDRASDGGARREDDRLLPREPAGAPTRRALVDLLHFDHAVVTRLQRDGGLRELFAGTARPARRGVDAARGDDPDQDRMRLVRLLSSAPPTEGTELREVLQRRLAAPDVFELPLIVVEGELRASFDELELLRATIAVARPLGSGDKRIAPIVQHATEQLDASAPPTGDVAIALAHQIEQATQHLSLPARYVERAVERTLLEGRKLRRRDVFGGKQLRGELGLTGPYQHLPTYFSEDVAKRLPLLQSFQAILLGELRPREDAAETEREAFLAFAVARRLDPRSVP